MKKSKLIIILFVLFLMLNPIYCQSTIADKQKNTNTDITFLKTLEII